MYFFFNTAEFIGIDSKQCIDETLYFYRHWEYFDEVMAK